MFDENFMLKTETARHLFFDYAKALPIIDYHCHLSPQELYENKPFANIGEMWLKGDHYKWRIMRNNGVDERYITGDADYYEKFLKFMECLQYAAGNPMYHWCKLELKRYFDVDDELTAANAKRIWDKCSEKTYTPQQLVALSNVECICTTDKPDDLLDYHEKLKSLPTKVLPAFRPDLSANLGHLCERMDYFAERGCVLSDHAVDDWTQVDKLVKLGEEYAKRGWTMQLHVGALRNTNPEMFKKLGPDTGFDSVNDFAIAEKLAGLIGRMENRPKLILYSLNPTHNAVISSMTGDFRNVQHGSAWWFNDHNDGMRDQMKSLASVGALNKFVGMLTDSRSFLSYTRHEYFRRILCDILGDWVENGEFIADDEILKTIVEGVCYKNAKEFFGF